MPIYAEKNMRYAHVAEIRKKYGNKRNTQRSHIRIKQTRLNRQVDRVQVAGGRTAATSSQI